jgi:general secretion pathway protein G
MQTCDSCKGQVPDIAAYCSTCGRPLLKRRPATTQTSPALIVAIAAVVAIPVFVAVIGIIAAIAIPNLLDAIERSRQKRTMAEIQTVVAGIQSYRRDHETVPVIGQFQDEGWHFVDAKELGKTLAPDFVQVVPAADGWGSPYRYGFTGDGKSFCLISGGGDRKINTEDPPTDFVSTHCYESDIVWLNDGSVRWPDGRQRKCGHDATP